MDLALKWRDCAYLRDLLEQPEAVARTIAGLADERGLDRMAGGLRGGRWRRVVLTGMGSSCYACRPLYLRLLKEGVTPVMVEAGELIHYERDWLTPDTLVIAVSQSGRSAEIVRLMECARGQSEIVGVTNTADSPLATESTATLLMHAGIESTVCWTRRVRPLSRCTTICAGGPPTWPNSGRLWKAWNTFSWPGVEPR